ncbi:MAG: ATP-binding protein [Myxococcales bacterium]|nr:ATP-binding protein [Myxococcales bacterium]
MTVTPYAEPMAHLLDQLVIVRVALQAAVARRGGGDEAARDLEVEQARLDAESRARAAVSAPAAVPLERLRGVFQLSPTEIGVLVLLAGLELDVKLREYARGVMADAARTAPDVGLLDEVLYVGTARGHMPEELGADGTLVQFGLIHVEPIADAAFALRRVRAVERVIDLLHGKDVLDRRVARFAELITARDRAELVLAPGAYEEIGGLLTAAVQISRTGTAHPVIVLSGPAGSGRTTLLAAAALPVGLRTLRVRGAALPRDEPSLRALGAILVREAVLWGALLLLDGVDQRPTDGAGHELDEIMFSWYPGPVAATAGRITGKPPQFARGVVVIELGIPDEPAREELWQRALPPAVAPTLARWAAERYFVTPGVIDQAAVAAIARAEARGAGAPALDAADVHEGLRGVLDAKLTTLGMRITWRQRWDDLVLPDEAALDVREFIARVKHRRRVFLEWGFGRKVAKGLGLSALFSGPPGTGKTMVAGLIATELKLDLYQIDLSKVVSKWVGETEKNLGELFDAAEAGHAILLFDEADSLFAKRTEVKSSNDRYANLEVNYLLQRMESFSGIVILTTNHDTAIDDAFRRRLSLRVEFPVPEPDERALLWRALLPPEAAIDPDLDFAALGDRFEMTGGYIKNAAVRAAFLAADEGTAIGMRHLVRAARAEYTAMGKVVSQL